MLHCTLRDRKFDNVFPVVRIILRLLIIIGSNLNIKLSLTMVLVFYFKSSSIDIFIRPEGEDHKKKLY